MNFDISNFENKVFFIGYNKTATCSIHDIFIKNNIKSLHYPPWNNLPLSEYQVFSDSGDVLNFKTLFNYEIFEKSHPSSMFVLNTRSLDGWLRSMSLHNYWRGKYKGNTYGYPITKEHIKRWVINKNKYYMDLLLYFMDKPSKILVLDIDKPDWTNYMCKFFGLKHYNIWLNGANDPILSWRKRVQNSGKKSVPDKYLNRIEKSISGAYNDLNIKDYNSSLLIKSLTPESVYAKISNHYDT